MFFYVQPDISSLNLPKGVDYKYRTETFPQITTSSLHLVESKSQFIDLARANSEAPIDKFMI